MSLTTIQRLLATMSSASIIAMTASFPAFAEVDADAAKALLKKNDCFKCHAPDKTKKGPSLKKISAKYKEKKLDDQEMVKHMLAGKKVKLEDGSEEDHKIIDTKDPKEQTNVARWILSH